MELFDNITNFLIDDLKKNITESAHISLAAGSFSIYAYQALKKELAAAGELRFIFTAPSFIRDKDPDEEHESHVARIARERSIFGAAHEIKLRNELAQKAIAHECADWIRKKVKFRSNSTQENMEGFLNIASATCQCNYLPLNSFTTGDLGLEKGNNAYKMIVKLENRESQQFLDLFNALWKDEEKLQTVTAEVLAILANAYRENSPELIYLLTIYALFRDFLADSRDSLPNEATGFKNSAIWNKLYDFQKDAALGVIHKLERFNGCILADSVGLGKTFTALAIIKYYESRNKSVLVLCPKKIAANWLAYKANYRDNPLAADRLRYDVLYHTDLSRDYGASGGLDIEKLDWGNYDLVVIDESHNFRNGGQLIQSGRENRYLRLLNRVIRAGIRTRVLMLSATPVNNRFQDLRNQLALAYEGDESQWNGKLKISKGIAAIFNNAQRVFNSWYRLPQATRTLGSLLSMLDRDFFEILDAVTIARSRKHIAKYYDMAALGNFPVRLPPLSIRPKLTSLAGIDYTLIFQKLSLLNLEVYSPSLHIFPSKREKYENARGNLSQSGREEGIRRLMAINLLKRLESSVNSFLLTVRKIRNLVEAAIRAVNAHEKNSGNAQFGLEQDNADFDLDDQNLDFLAQAQKLAVNLADIDYRSWRSQMQADLLILTELEALAARIEPAFDAKLQALLGLIDQKQAQPLNGHNKKLLIFTAFADTACYLFGQIGGYARDKYGIHTALVTGTGSGAVTIAGMRPDLNAILANFAPIAKERGQGQGNAGADIDILIATDCLSEGQNLQDCDYVVNYDIHWNPVRIIQRFGRIDRIGSPNRQIRLVNFWPDITLDEYINLKERVELRMKATVLAATGDDDLLDAAEKGDLDYRRRQLAQLQDSIPDLEDMAGGIAITDLGLDEFRQDLPALLAKYGDLELVPHGVSAVVQATPACPAGVIFVLRKIGAAANGLARNRLYPFYLIYLDMAGQTVISHLAPQKVLQAMRLLCKGKDRPEQRLCAAFNRETRDGRDMRRYSRLLAEAITALIGAKEESDLDSLFQAGGTSALNNPIHGLDDFELLCFLVIR